MTSRQEPIGSPFGYRSTAEEVVAVACLAALVVITLLNVVTRYVTQQSYAWTEEISIVLMVAIGKKTAASTFRRWAETLIS